MRDCQTRYLVTVAMAALVAMAGAGCGASDPAPIDQLPKEKRPTNFVEGVVELSPALAEQANGEAALFLFLRSQPGKDTGRGAPIATLRSDMARLPYRFVLTEENGMFGKASFAQPMVLGARWSKSGDQVGQPGDIEGECTSNPVTGGARGLTIRLDRVVTERRESPMPGAGGTGAVGPHGAAVTPPAVGGASAPQAGASIAGVVELDPAIAEHFAPGDTLFIFLRVPVQGRPRGMPLATIKRSVEAFPFTFTLGSGDRIFDNMPFEGPMLLGARLSKSGDPIGQPGDLEGEFPGNPVQPGQSGLRLVLDKVVSEKRVSPMNQPTPAGGYE